MIVSIFRARLKPGIDDEYMAWVQRLEEVAETMPGYLSRKAFAAPDGERVSLVEFDTEEHLRAWSMNVEHANAKKHGRENFYLAYRVQVCEVLRATQFAVGGRPASAATKLSNPWA